MCTENTGRCNTDQETFVEHEIVPRMAITRAETKDYAPKKQKKNLLEREKGNRKVRKVRKVTCTVFFSLLFLFSFFHPGRIPSPIRKQAPSSAGAATRALNRRIRKVVR